MDKEVGEMESELYSISVRSRDMMSDDRRNETIQDMALVLLAMNERLKRLEVDENAWLNI